MGDIGVPEWGSTCSVASSGSITAVIASDSTLVAEGLRAMLAPHHQVSVVASAVGQVPNAQADILLMDAIGHPDAGLARVRNARDSNLFSRIGLLVWRITDDHCAKALDAGADAVLNKACDTADLVTAIQHVVAGEQVIHTFPHHVWTERWVDGGNVHLTPREVQLLSLLANGLTNKEISAVMFIAESSAKTYLKRIYKKINVSNRSQATLRAVQLGLAGPTVGHQG